MRLKDFKDINHALSNIWLNAPATWKTDETLDAHRKQVHRWRAARKRRTGKRYGVSWDRTRNKWTVRIQHKGKQTKLGRFRDEISAAHAWDAFVVRHGLMRPLNFSLDDIELEFVMFDGFTNFAEAIWRRAPVTWKTLDALTSHAHQMRHWRRKLKNTAYDALRATFGSHRIACDGGHPSVARVFNAMIDRGTLHMCMPELTAGSQRVYASDARRHASARWSNRGCATLVKVNTHTRELLTFQLNLTTRELTLCTRAPSNHMPDEHTNVEGTRRITGPQSELDGKDITNVAGAPVACLDDTAFAAMFALWCEPDSEPSCALSCEDIRRSIATRNMWMGFHLFVTKHIAAMHISLTA